MTVRMKENKYLCVKKKMGEEKASFDCMHRGAWHEFSIMFWCLLVSKGALILTHSNYFITV